LEDLECGGNAAALALFVKFERNIRNAPAVQLKAKAPPLAAIGGALQTVTAT
jgi:hypothetical protein